MTGPVLRVEGAVRHYGERRALDGVDLTLARGEWVALLGPNGAGKTTLMRAVAGRVELDAGSASIDGHPAGSRPARRRIGLVPQRLALYPRLTVVENLQVFARLHGVAPRGVAACVDGALAWSGLADRARERAGSLSGGMQRRLNIACGVLHSPPLLLLDEPTAGVDAASRAHLRDLLAGLRDRGVTVLESTHQLEAVESSCDRVLVMHGGRLLAAGTVAALGAASRREGQRCHVVLDRAADGLAPGAGLEVRGAVVSGLLPGGAGALRELLKRIDAAGLAVRELRVEAPALEEVLEGVIAKETGA